MSSRLKLRLLLGLRMITRRSNLDPETQAALIVLEILEELAFKYGEHAPECRKLDRIIRYILREAEKDVITNTNP